MQQSLENKINVGRLNHELHHLVNKRLNREFKKAELGITADQFRLLVNLWKQDGMNQLHLACALDRDRATITRMINVLENEGIVARIPDKDDKRARLVYLTLKGKNLRDNAKKCAERVNQDMLASFSEEEKELLRNFLIRAKENIK